MKSKKNLYILIPAVVFIWGFVIIKIIDFTKDEKVHYQSSLDYNIEINKNDSISNKYELNLNYRDPFLSRIDKSMEIRKFNALQLINVNKIENKEPTPPIINNIQYMGVVEKPGQAKLGLIKINGITQMLKENEQYEEILVKRIFADSIKVDIKGKAYYFNTVN